MLLYFFDGGGGGGEGCLLLGVRVIVVFWGLA